MYALTIETTTPGHETTLGLVGPFLSREDAFDVAEEWHVSPDTRVNVVELVVQVDR